MRYKADDLQQERDRTKQDHFVVVGGKEQRDVGSRKSERDPTCPSSVAGGLEAERSVRIAVRDCEGECRKPNSSGAVAICS